MILCYIAVGSNLGEREENIRQAIQALRESEAIAVVRTSPLYETKAEGIESDAPPFLNGAIEIATSRSPQELLQRLLEIEKRLGRVRDKEIHASRTIDLDLLLYGDEIVNEPEVSVPHPRMHQRRFVLQPLSDLCPKRTIPGRKETILEALERL